MLFAGIAFGPLGPVQHLTYADTRVRVDVAYRIAADRQYGSGEDALGPSIATGSVTFVVGGVRRVVDLAALFPIREHHINLAPEASCGTGAPFARRGAYLAIEAILGEKGCAPLIAVIDLDTGAPLERVALDHPSAHRFDARVEPFTGERLRVERARLLRLPAKIIQLSGPPLAEPLWIVVVRAVDTRARIRELAYGAFDFDAAGGDEPKDTVPRAGSDIIVGRLHKVIPFTRTTMLDEPLVRLSRLDEARFEANQTPVPPDRAQIVRRNSWFAVASEAVEREDFDAAVDAMRHMVLIDSGPPGFDPSIGRMDESELASCRALLVRLRAGKLSKAAAKTLFRVGCVALTAPVPPARPAP